MKHIIYSGLIILVMELLTPGCANPKTPTGGEKDTIPPTLLQSNPLDQTLNFSEQTIQLTFDEYVTAEKLTQNLIITPITDIKYKTLVKKQTVTIRFEQAFDDSTTYTLNFFDGITDITERNPAENLIIAFSTGNYIDSLFMFGNIRDLFSGKPTPKVTVGLYRLTDTLDFKTVKPTYFINTDENGAFRLQNIKANNYRLLAFEDENKNLLFDPSTEKHGFLNDTISLNESLSDSLNIRIVDIDASELKFNSARPSGLYYEVRYTKPIVSYSLLTQDITAVPSQLTAEKESIRFYNTSLIADSLQTIITVTDSLRNQRTDTVYVQFKESSRKAESYSVTLTPGSNTAIFTNPSFSINFNKPSRLIDSLSIQIPIDTLYTLNFPIQNYSYNHNNTALSFSWSINSQIIKDSLSALLNLHPIDTTNIDSTQLRIHNILTKIPTDRFQLTIPAATFVSVEKDSSQQITQAYKFAKPEEFGIIRANVTTSETSYTIQLMSQTKPIQSLTNCRACIFQHIPPGKYWVRVLIDSNQDSTWTYGNILKNIEPEPVYYFPEETTLRANWDVELPISF